MSRVVVGMSGGVDSAVAAYLLKKAGHEVIGVTLKTWEGKDSRCCDVSEAREMALRMGIPHSVHSAASDFECRVVQPFIGDYLHGRTPNPCVECNRYVKWAQLLDAASVMGADFAATGHYARIAQLPNGRYAIRRATSLRKDQSYVLYKLTQQQLSRTLLPLGEYDKEEVRAIAERVGISAAQKPDSQEICFVTEGNYTDYIECETDAELPPPGNFVDAEGNVLGTHKGIAHYTVGQRKGLGLALGYPVYVTAIAPEKNEVVIGGEESLYRSSILCNDLNFMSVGTIGRGETLPAFVKIRYNHKGATASLEMNDDGTLTAVFDSPVRAPTPGQSAVFFDEDGYIIGGGKIISSR
ncbi:MAG: tRNA 2-thiouridine(34) synthase MnmA [Schwartzia succinivorans]|nr:tRNA 2-thiouridine(34) synthase MnmA [Schwartzia succinivorans]